MRFSYLNHESNFIFFPLFEGLAEALHKHVNELCSPTAGLVKGDLDRLLSQLRVSQTTTAADGHTSSKEETASVEMPSVRRLQSWAKQSGPTALATLLQAMNDIDLVEHPLSTVTYGRRSPSSSDPYAHAVPEQSASDQSLVES